MEKTEGNAAKYNQARYSEDYEFSNLLESSHGSISKQRREGAIGDLQAGPSKCLPPDSNYSKSSLPKNAKEPFEARASKRSFSPMPECSEVAGNEGVGEPMVKKSKTNDIDQFSLQERKQKIQQLQEVIDAAKGKLLKSQSLESHLNNILFRLVLTRANASLISMRIRSGGTLSEEDEAFWLSTCIDDFLVKNPRFRSPY